MKTPNDITVTLKLKRLEVSDLLAVAWVLERATYKERWRQRKEIILRALNDSDLSGIGSVVLKLKKSEVCELLQGIAAIERVSDAERWKLLRENMLRALYECEAEENAKMKEQMDNKYISYRIYEAPAVPSEKGKYIARTPLLPQALRACEMAKERGKSWFIKGITPDGAEVLLL